jgi:hypothetical protein
MRMTSISRRSGDCIVVKMALNVCIVDDAFSLAEYCHSKAKAYELKGMRGVLEQRLVCSVVTFIVMRVSQESTLSW